MLLLFCAYLGFIRWNLKSRRRFEAHYDLKRTIYFLWSSRIPSDFGSKTPVSLSHKSIHNLLNIFHHNTFLSFILYYNVSLKKLYISIDFSNISALTSVSRSVWLLLAACARKYMSSSGRGSATFHREACMSR